MPKYIKTGYPQDIIVGTYEVDRRFRADMVVLKTESDLLGLTQAQALNLAAALLETVSELQASREE